MFLEFFVEEFTGFVMFGMALAIYKYKQFERGCKYGKCSLRSKQTLERNRIMERCNRRAME